MSHDLRIKGWNSEFIGGRQHVLTPTNYYRGMTGNDVETLLQLDFPYRINRIDFKHTTANLLVDSYDLLDYSIYRSLKTGSFLLFCADSSHHPDVNLEGGDRYEFPASVLKIVLKSTNLDRVQIIVTVQKKR